VQPSRQNCGELEYTLSLELGNSIKGTLVRAYRQLAEDCSEICAMKQAGKEQKNQGRTSRELAHNTGLINICYRE
jgi:hypothetical protein